MIRLPSTRRLHPWHPARKTMARCSIKFYLPDSIRSWSQSAIQTSAAGSSKLASSCPDRPPLHLWLLLCHMRCRTIMPEVQAFGYWKVEILVNALSAMKAGPAGSLRGGGSLSAERPRLLLILFVFDALRMFGTGQATLQGCIELTSC